ncbi:MAG: hypothetical protein ACSHWZ_00475 [Sulfitobacter sp.]
MLVVLVVEPPLNPASAPAAINGTTSGAKLVIGALSLGRFKHSTAATFAGAAQSIGASCASKDAAQETEISVLRIKGRCIAFS